MEYPKNGSVVIVDDKIDDVEELILSFSHKNVPTYYFTGKEEKLHRMLDNIKLIFLDAEYLHNQQAQVTNKTDYMAKIISRLINENAGEYIIVTWSTTSESFKERLYERLNSIYNINDKLPEDKKLYKLPKKILGIKKGDVQHNGRFDIDLINKEINDVLDDTDILNLSISWENNVLESAKNVLRNFDKIASSEEDKKKLFALFADSISKNDHLNESNILKPALSPISELLSDQLSQLNNNIVNNDIGKELLLQIDNKLDIDSVAKINTFYHIDNNIDNTHAPGTVYDYNQYIENYSCSTNNCETQWAENLTEKVFEKISLPNNKFTLDFTSKFSSSSVKDIFNELAKERSDILIELNRLTSEDKDLSEIALYNNISKDKDKKRLLKAFFLENEKKKYLKDLINSTTPVFLEFSPDCDFVQAKRKKLRLVFGLLIPYNFKDIITNEKKLKALKFDGDNIIPTPVISNSGSIYQVIFDLQTITGINENAFKGMAPLFRFRKELVVDIQQKIATHISRPGFFNMNDYID